MNGKSRDSRDSSDMFFSRRSRFTLAILQYNAVVFLLVAGPAFCYFYYYTRPAHVIDNSIVFDLACAVALLVLLPGDGLVWLNVLFNLLPPRPDRYRNQPKVRNFSRLLICLASKGDNVDAVERTVRSMHGWQQVHKKISFHIVTEEPKAQAFYQRFAKDDDVEVVAVPVGFSAKKAKYKARALEYARSHFQLTSSDWVLHLDEETFVDAYALKACIDVIERTRFDFAQGYIFYNHHGYWNNWLLTLGDLVRVTDDIGRYQWQANFLGSPVLGVHGSFFMINGEVENVTTWDTDNLTEDYWFATRVCSPFFSLYLQPGEKKWRERERERERLMMLNRHKNSASNTDGSPPSLGNSPPALSKIMSSSDAGGGGVFAP